MIEELRPQAERKGLRLTVVKRVERSVVNTDAQLIRVIVVNLIGNAVKFTERGLIEVGLSLSGAEYRISVKDEGPGIPAKDHQRIFEPFERLEPRDNKHTSGFGLGLAASKKLSEALGGRIEVASEIGSGSTFTLVLPSENPF